MFVSAVKKCEEAYQRSKGGEGSQVGVKECQPETKPAPLTPSRVMLAKRHDITPGAVATSSGSCKFRTGVCDVTLPVLLGDHFDVEGGVGGGGVAEGGFAIVYVAAVLCALQIARALPCVWPWAHVWRCAVCICTKSTASCALNAKSVAAPNHKTPPHPPTHNTHSLNTHTRAHLERHVKPKCSNAALRWR